MKIEKEKRNKKNPLVKLLLSRSLSFLHNNLNFLRNWSEEHAELQFQIPHLE